MGNVVEIRRRTRVLLVEDEPLISELAVEALEEQGFVVEVVSNAFDALRRLASGRTIDILFTDINLPGGMTGAELARKARALKPELPVVYASGRYRGDDLDGLVPHAAFLPKPYDQRKLAHVLEQIAVGTAH